MRLTLLSPDGLQLSHTIVVGDQPAIAGRDPGVHIPLPDRRTSNRHCEFREVGGKLLVRDLNSKNGTFVDGVRISQTFLESGQTIVIGRVEFIVQCEHGADAVPSEAAAALVVGRRADVGGSEAAPHGGSAPWNGRDAAAANHSPRLAPESCEETAILAEDGTELERLSRKEVRARRRSAAPLADPATLALSPAVSPGAPPPATIPRPESGRTEAAAPCAPAPADANLAELLDIWPRVPLSVQAGILAMIRAMSVENTPKR